jgi:hypothetical protein
MFLGIPFNIASVSLLTYIIAKITDKKPGYISIIIGDAHIYESHIEQVKTQLNREPYQLPILEINEKYSNINDYQFENFELNGKIFISKENRGNDRFSFYCGLSIDGGLSDTLKCSKYVIDSFTKIGLTCSPDYLDRNRRFDVNVSDDDFFYINKPLKGDYEGTLTALKNVFKSDGFSIDEGRR